MCEEFGDDLKRVTLWDRVTSALKAAAAKCDDGDLERFAALCLEHVKADEAKAARNGRFVNWLLSAETRDEAWRQSFVRQCGGAMAAVLVVHAGRAWDEVKAERAAERDARKGEAQ